MGRGPLGAGKVAPILAENADASLAPSGEVGCERIGGRPLVRFELARHDVPRPSTVIDRLFEASRARWKDLESDPDQKVLYHAEGSDWFQYVVGMHRRRTNSAIRVRRSAPGEMWSHGHLLRGRTVNCSMHYYAVSSEGDLGRLRERVEVRSTSSLLTFYRHRMERDAVRAASEQLDELMRELRSG